jgi:hypothetical protein
MANASLTINFSTYSSSSTTGDIDLSVGLDEALNGGKTSFVFGDTAYFQIFTNATTIKIHKSIGTVTDNGTGQIAMSEMLAFNGVPGSDPADNTANLTYTPKGAVTFKVIAGGAGAFSVSGSTVQASQAGLAVVQADYDAEYLSKSISGVNKPANWPDDITYPVVVVVEAS